MSIAQRLQNRYSIFVDTTNIANTLDDTKEKKEYEYDANNQLILG